MNRPRAAAPVARAVVVVFVAAAAMYGYRSLAAAGARDRTEQATPAAAHPATRQILSIDPVTGQPRDPTPAELAALQAPPSGAPPQPVVSPTTGLQGLRLSDDQMVYSVATKKADGTVAITEVTGAKAADKAVAADDAPELHVGKEPSDVR
jgi:hypothetical protein